MSDNLYARGPLYTILILPLVAIMLLNLLGTLRRKDRLSPMVYRSFLIAILPMTGSLIVLLFVEVYPLLDVSFVLSAMAMFGLILSDQIDQNLTHQREIAEQQREIANQHASIMVLQMRPHFIYNTLMSIYSLCNQDPQKARQVTKDFTDYLRRNFKAVAGEDAIPFSAELEHTRAYLAVEQAQHEEMLLVDYDVRFTRFRLPPLTLQPIVENAVKHGMDPYAGPLHVTVRTYRVDRAGGAGSTGGASVIVVEDNGPGFDTAGLNESHEAMTNIRQRLELMCDGKMEVASRETGGTTVTVTIPDRNAEE
jgi:LytS/YehU family sensor histidine kinase